MEGLPLRRGNQLPVFGFSFLASYLTTLPCPHHLSTLEELDSNPSSLGLPLEAVGVLKCFSHRFSDNLLVTPLGG